MTVAVPGGGGGAAGGGALGDAVEDVVLGAGVAGGGALGDGLMLETVQVSDARMQVAVSQKAPLAHLVAPHALYPELQAARSIRCAERR